MSEFTVDLAELDGVVSRMAAFGTAFGDRLGDLESALGVLEQDWLGEAAVAQAEAHQRIAAGAQQMREALLALREAARHAHASYGVAVDANVATWKQLR